MGCLLLILTSILYLTAASSPVSYHHHAATRAFNVFCQLPILNILLCPGTNSSTVDIHTDIGIASGTPGSAGAIRFTVRYATAKRWESSIPSSVWSLPLSTLDPSSLPLPCPQSGFDLAASTEDCLSMILYVPMTLISTRNAPTLMWIHGGSFVAGAATNPGLDGTKLAVATNSIVAVVQYRLGVLGYMSPDGRTNLAVGDIINAMNFLRKIVPAFGGSPSSITLAGQSSGANMIRAILAAPSASPLFQSAILHSDPMDFGFLSTTTQGILQKSFNQIINCSPADFNCRNALSLEQIISAQENLFAAAPSLDPSAGIAEPIRPVLDKILITTPLDSTAPFPSVNKHLLVSTVVNDAGPTLFTRPDFQSKLPAVAFFIVANATLGPDRAEKVSASSFYTIVPDSDGEMDSRIQLERLATDYLFRCPTWTFARNWANNGGTVYVGQYQVGATYTVNNLVPFCLSPGVVCHQDDIEIVFGTTPNPTDTQAALSKEVQARYKAFLRGGDPNVSGYTRWMVATPQDVHALRFGGSGEVSQGACDPAFWGAAVQYDYQLFDI